MRMLTYFFSFQGRIGRLGYLGRNLAFLGIVIVGAILLGVATGFPGYYIMSQLAAMQTLPPQAQVAALQAIVAACKGMLIYIGVMYMVFFFVALSTQARRLHDLDRSGWWVVPPFLVAVAANMFRATMAASAPRTADPQVMLTQPASIVAIVAGIVLLVYSLYILLWPGTKGDNQYGESPNPLYRGGTYTKVKGRPSVGKTIIATLDTPVPEDQLAMMTIIRTENPDIEKIFVSPDRDRIEFVMGAGSAINRRTVAKILKDFGFTVQQIEMG